MKRPRCLVMKWENTSVLILWILIDIGVMWRQVQTAYFKTFNILMCLMSIRNKILDINVRSERNNYLIFNAVSIWRLQMSYFIHHWLTWNFKGFYSDMHSNKQNTFFFFFLKKTPEKVQMPVVSSADSIERVTRTMSKITRRARSIWRQKPQIVTQSWKTLETLVKCYFSQLH